MSSNLENVTCCSIKSGPYTYVENSTPASNASFIISNLDSSTCCWKQPSKDSKIQNWTPTPFPSPTSLLSPSLTFLQNSTELTKKPSNGPVWHSYFLSSVWCVL